MEERNKSCKNDSENKCLPAEVFKGDFFSFARTFSLASGFVTGSEPNNFARTNTSFVEATCCFSVSNASQIFPTQQL